MSHDTFNTRGGAVGFSVQLADGTFVREDEATWDEVAGPIRSLAVRRLRVDHDIVRLDGFERYFFSNVAVARRRGGVPGAGEHVGKVIGGVNGDKAVRIEISFDPPRARKIECPTSDLTYEPHAFRAGVK